MVPQSGAGVGGGGGPGGGGVGGGGWILNVISQCKL